MLMMLAAYQKLVQINESVGCLEQGAFDFLSSCQKVPQNYPRCFKLILSQQMLALRRITLYNFDLCDCSLVLIQIAQVLKNIPVNVVLFLENRQKLYHYCM